MHPLGSIKKWLGNKKKKNQRRQRAREAADKAMSEAERAYLRNKIALVSDFTPQAKGSEATSEWLERRTPESLSRLKIERDRAAKQNSRGPQTKGTREVKEILMKPCRTTVEQLHNVREQAELTVRYGTATAAVMYNLGKSMNRKSHAPPKLPSLQLKDFTTMVKEQLDIVSRLPGSALGAMTLRSSVDLRTPRRVSSEASPPAKERSKSKRHRSEKGDVKHNSQTTDTGRASKGHRKGSSSSCSSSGSRDDHRALPPLPVSSDSENDTYESSLQLPVHRTAEEQWEAQEQATIMSIVQVPTQVVRKVQIKGNKRKQKQLRPLSRISEVSEVSTVRERGTR